LLASCRLEQDLLSSVTYAKCIGLKHINIEVINNAQD